MEDESASPGNIRGISSCQVFPGGIGMTSLSSRIDPPVVCEGNHHGVVTSPERIRFSQKICTRALVIRPSSLVLRAPRVREPVRNASGTNPIASQKWFASKSCAHQQQ